MNQMPIRNIEWMGDLADDFDKYAEEGGVHFKPAVLRALASCLRRAPLEKLFAWEQD